MSVSELLSERGSKNKPLCQHSTFHLADSNNLVAKINNFFNTTKNRKKGSVLFVRFLSFYNKNRKKGTVLFVRFLSFYNKNRKKGSVLFVRFLSFCDKNNEKKIDTRGSNANARVSIDVVMPLV